MCSNLPPGMSVSMPTREKRDAGAAAGRKFRRDPAKVRSFELAGRPNVFAGPNRFRLRAKGFDRPNLHRTRRAGSRWPSARGGTTAAGQVRTGRRRTDRVARARAGPVDRSTTSAHRRPSTRTKLIAVEVITTRRQTGRPTHRTSTTSTPNANGRWRRSTTSRIDRNGFGYQRVYSSGREIDVLQEVRSGDHVLIPHGYHGPSMGRARLSHVLPET